MLFSRECSTKCSPFASSSGLLESRDSECWRTIHSRKCGSKLRRYRKICRGSLDIGCTSFVYWRLAKRHIAPEYSMNILVETLVKYWISSFSSPKTWVCHFILSSFMYIYIYYIYTCVWYRFIYIYMYIHHFRMVPMIGPCSTTFLMVNDGDFWWRRNRLPVQGSKLIIARMDVSLTISTPGYVYIYNYVYVYYML